MQRATFLITAYGGVRGGGGGGAFIAAFAIMPVCYRSGVYPFGNARVVTKGKERGILSFRFFFRSPRAEGPSFLPRSARFFEFGARCGFAATCRCLDAISIISFDVSKRNIPHVRSRGPPSTIDAPFEKDRGEGRRSQRKKSGQGIFPRTQPIVRRRK